MRQGQTNHNGLKWSCHLLLVLLLLKEIWEDEENLGWKDVLKVATRRKVPKMLNVAMLLPQLMMLCQPMLKGRKWLETQWLARNAVKRVTGKLVPSVHSMGQRKRGNYYFFVPTLGSPYHYKYYLFTCRKRQQPRKNNTKDNPDRLSTPQRPTREQILRDSPGRIMRRYKIVTHLTYVILL